MKNSNTNLVFTERIDINKMSLIISLDNFIIEKVELMAL